MLGRVEAIVESTAVKLHTCAVEFERIASAEVGELVHTARGGMRTILLKDRAARSVGASIAGRAAKSAIRAAAAATPAATRGFLATVAHPLLLPAAQYVGGIALAAAVPKLLKALKPAAPAIAAPAPAYTWWLPPMPHDTAISDVPLHSLTLILLALIAAVVCGVLVLVRKSSLLRTSRGASDIPPVSEMSSTNEVLRALNLRKSPSVDSSPHSSPNRKEISDPYYKTYGVMPPVFAPAAADMEAVRAAEEAAMEAYDDEAQLYSPTTGMGAALSSLGERTATPSEIKSAKERAQLLYTRSTQASWIEDEMKRSESLEMLADMMRGDDSPDEEAPRTPPRSIRPSEMASETAAEKDTYASPDTITSDLSALARPLVLHLPMSPARTPPVTPDKGLLCRVYGILGSTSPRGSPVRASPRSVTAAELLPPSPVGGRA